MKNTKHSVLTGAATALALCLLAALPGKLLAGAFSPGTVSVDPAVSERPNERRILISWNLDFTGNTTADGTSTIAGAFSDEGARHEDFTVTVNSSQTEATVTGTIVVHGANGDLREQFTGRIPLGQNPTFIEGVGMFTGGTGAYAGVTGRATFEGTINFATGKLVGITEGTAKIAR